MTRIAIWMGPGFDPHAHRFLEYNRKYCLQGTSRYILSGGCGKSIYAGTVIIIQKF